MVFSLFPAFLSDELGFSGTLIGLMEGLAIFFSFSMRLFSGVLSDHLHARKPFIIAGSVLSTLLKPAFALTTGAFMAMGIRILDRSSKGIRAAPIDALVSDLTPREKRGAAFGLRQSFKTFGVIAGGILGSLCMHLFENNFRITFFIATIPAFLSIALSLALKDPLTTKNRPSRTWKLSEIKRLPKPYWEILGFCMLLFCAYFSEFFITLRFKEAGVSLKWLPLFVVGMNLIHGFSAYPFGKLSDRMPKEQMLLLGMGLLFFVNLVLGVFSSFWVVAIGIIFVGLHMGINRGLVRAMLSEHVPSDLRGTAFAVFYFLTGFSLLGANYVAGLLFDAHGAKGPFWSGAFFAGLCLLYLIGLLKKRKRS